MSTPALQPPVANFTRYLSPTFIDFRIQLGPTSFPFDESVLETARVMRAFKIAEVAVLPLMWLLGFWLAYLKMVRVRVSLWMVVNGALVPRGPELWILCSSVFIFLQWVNAILLLTDAFPNFTAKETFFEFKWAIAYNGATHYLISLMHATPKPPPTSSYLLNRKHTTTPPIRKLLPKNVLLNSTYVLLSSLSLFTLSFAIATGLAADRGDDERAALYLEAHYGSWSVCVGVYTSILGFFAWRLVQILRRNANMFSVQALVAVPAASGGGVLGGRSQQQDSVAEETTTTITTTITTTTTTLSAKSAVEVGLTPPPAPLPAIGSQMLQSYTSVGKPPAAAVASDLRRRQRQVIVMLVTIAGISSITIMFFVLLTAYALKRTAMHQISGIYKYFEAWLFVTTFFFYAAVNIFIAVLATFNPPLLMAMTYLGFLYLANSPRAKIAPACVR
ncbi:hypothetical protein HDV05_006403 [Chytridiales sp. JEL 0842]|nr:hypothetical protein HDV05_006403 [Chytridiales sp. JEL 0842]